VQLPLVRHLLAVEPFDRFYGRRELGRPARKEDVALVEAESQGSDDPHVSGLVLVVDTIDGMSPM
jgi:hypothetical protein